MSFAFGGNIANLYNGNGRVAGSNATSQDVMARLNAGSKINITLFPNVIEDLLNNNPLVSNLIKLPIQAVLEQSPHFSINGVAADKNETIMSFVSHLNDINYKKIINDFLTEVAAYGTAFLYAEDVNVFGKRSKDQINKDLNPIEKGDIINYRISNQWKMMGDNISSAMGLYSNNTLNYNKGTVNNRKRDSKGNETIYEPRPYEEKAMLMHPERMMVLGYGRPVGLQTFIASMAKINRHQIESLIDMNVTDDYNSVISKVSEYKDSVWCLSILENKLESLLLYDAVHQNLNLDVQNKVKLIINQKGSDLADVNQEYRDETNRAIAEMAAGPTQQSILHVIDTEVKTVEGVGITQDHQQQARNAISANWGIPLNIAFGESSTQTTGVEAEQQFLRNGDVMLYRQYAPKIIKMLFDHWLIITGQSFKDRISVDFMPSNNSTIKQKEELKQVEIQTKLAQIEYLDALVSRGDMSRKQAWDHKKEMGLLPDNAKMEEMPDSYFDPGEDEENESNIDKPDVIKKKHEPKNHKDKMEDIQNRV